MSLNERIKLRFGMHVDAGDPIASNQTINQILSRRSIRKYSSEPVAEDMMQLLLATALSAPSKSDLQQVTIIRIKDSEKHKRIAGLSPSTAWAAAAPEFMIWCGDNRRIRLLCEWRQHRFANDHLDSFMNAAVDAAIAMQTFIIAAESQGLGCCPVSEIRNNIETLSDELDLPAWVFPVAGLCVGWPDEHKPISMRLPPSVSVHTDRYDDSELFEQVLNYDHRREAVDPTPPGRQRMVDRFGVSADYGWSENRSRQYAVAARSDFGRYVRRQKFDLS